MTSYYYYLIPVVFIVAFAAYYVLVIPKLKQQSAQGLEALRQSLKGHEEEKKAYYLGDESTLKPLADVLKGEQIGAIVSCMEKRNVKEVMKQKAVNALSDFSKELVGVEFKKEDNQDAYFLVVTRQGLYYLVFKEGELKEKIHYDPSKIHGVEWGRGTAKDMMIGGGQKNYGKITFNYEGEKISFFHLPVISFWPSGFMADNTEPSILFAEPFELKLKEVLGMGG